MIKMLLLRSQDNSVEARKEVSISCNLYRYFVTQLPKPEQNRLDCHWPIVMYITQTLQSAESWESQLSCVIVVMGR